MPTRLNVRTIDLRYASDEAFAPTINVASAGSRPPWAVSRLIDSPTDSRRAAATSEPLRIIAVKSPIPSQRTCGTVRSEL